ncbi:kinetochore protein SLK19-like [Chrysoperla carnea]|uniref:kinetochore protein SLK19-like n=1 Tax=Chrysoperla carnea TaxID=189513 RepID=UPI001D063071|nr:kinetochore protein SLK19-like [Chrysoperla carnea]
MDNAVVISSSSDEENNSKFTKKVSLKKNTSTQNIAKNSKKSKILGIVTLNDDGDDEEFQLDIHTKTREELEEQKLVIPRPQPSVAKVIEKPLPKLIPKPPEIDIVLQTNETNVIPKPLLPSLTITPVTKTNESESAQYLKVKDIDALKNNTTDQIEVNSTLEINQSTNLFIVNSDQNSSALLQEAIQKLSQQKSDIIVSQTPAKPLFQITNVHTLAKTNAKTTIKRKRAVEKNSKSKRIKSNNSSTSEIISLVDDENPIDTISLDSDSENDTKTENKSEDHKEIVSNCPPDDENSDEVVCIENAIENIDICSSSDTDSENTRGSQSNKKSERKNIQDVGTTELEKMQEKLQQKLNRYVGKVKKTVQTQIIEKTKQIQKSQENVKEFENTEELQNKEELTKVKEAETQNKTQLQKTKKIEEFEGSEKEIELLHNEEEGESISEVPNKTQIENAEKIELQNTDKTLEHQTNNKIVEIQSSEKTIALQSPAKKEEMQSPKKRIELQSPYKRIELQSPEKIIEQIIQSSPNLKVVLEKIEIPNQFDKIDSEKEDENDEINDNEILFEKFLETCSSDTVPNRCRLIINDSIGKIRKRYEKANIDYLNSNNFSQLLNKKIQEILATPISATVAFSEVLMDLKNNKQEKDDESNNMDKETLKKIKKLETMLKLLNKKIRQLEQAEMSLDDDWDENATYLKEDRYKRKSCQIYKKICELQNRDPNAGRLTLMKLNFEGSKYSKINQAINKLYNKKRQFPNLHDVTKCIKKCVERHKLKLTESQIDLEAREMFKLLGEKLQKRRQKETYQNLMSYPEEIVLEDPALKDIELEKKLRESHKEAHTRIEEIMNKFVQKQDSGEDACFNDENSATEKSASDAEDSEEDSNEDEEDT